MAINPLQKPLPDSIEARLHSIYIGGEDIESATVKINYDEVDIVSGSEAARRSQAERYQFDDVQDRLSDTVTVNGQTVTVQKLLRFLRQWADDLRSEQI